MTHEEGRPGYTGSGPLEGKTTADHAVPVIVLPTAATFPALRELLYLDGDRISISWEPGDGSAPFRSIVVDLADADAEVARHVDMCNVWHGVNPTTLPAGSRARGKSDEIARLSAMIADLDIKLGGFVTYDDAEDCIGEISSVIGTRPSFVVASGHGLQPYWPLDPESTVGLSIAAAEALAAAFGRLVSMVAWNCGKATADTVSDLARVFRTPGSTNMKFADEPIAVTARADTGHPISVKELTERLLEVGIEIEIESSTAVGEDVIAAPEGWHYDQTTYCVYVPAMVERWATDTVSNRNPWMFSQQHRIAAAHRLGCFFDAYTHQQAITSLHNRFRELLKTGDDRKERKYEFRDARERAIGRVSKMTESQARAELGGHVHDYVGSPEAPSLNGSEPTAATDDDDEAPAVSPFELLVGHTLAKMRVDREARRRLEDETRPTLLLPPVRNLDALLAEPDTVTRHLIDRVMPVDSRVLFSAAYKAGKTTMVGNLVRSLADGDDFLGQFEVHQTCSHIVLIDDEMSENMLRSWLRDQGIVHTAAVADTITLRGKVSTFDVIDETCRAMWVERLRGLQCDYLIVDCLRPILDSLGLDENHDAGKFLVAFDALLIEAGIAGAMLVQHMGHANERARGDSRLQDWPDALWKVARENDEPHSPRYFSAYGRDVDVFEGLLSFDEGTRRLTYSQGSRADAKTEGATKTVLAILAEDAKAAGNGMSGRAIEGVIDGAHTRAAVRKAIEQATNRGHVDFVIGAHSAKLHRIVNPCGTCGMPVVVGQGAEHFSCAQGEE